MFRNSILAATTAALVAGAAIAPMACAAEPAKPLAAALADRARPPEDVARDAARKPAELLAFGGLKSGDRAVDLIMGGGYFTRILAAAVGPKGHVWAYQPAEFIKFRAAYGEEQAKAAGAYANITPLNGPLSDLGLPSDVDFVLTVQNYHDLHLKPFASDTAAKVNAQVFKALKPGGVYLVVDHVAAPGAADAPNALHRIDPEAIKREVQAAGFKLEAESPMLRDAADPHAANVFDPSIRGKTDQVVLKFRKPK